MCYYIYNKVSYSNFLDTGPSLVDSLAEMVMERGSLARLNNQLPHQLLYLSVKNKHQSCFNVALLQISLPLSTEFGSGGRWRPRPEIPVLLVQSTLGARRFAIELPEQAPGLRLAHCLAGFNGRTGLHSTDSALP